MNTTGNDFGIMNMFQNSQTGSALLAEANRKGVKIEFKPDNGDTQRGKYNPNTNTITVEHASTEKMVETLGHELVHATTKDNGNSMKEEKMAFITGEKIAQELGVNKNPHSETFWNNHVDTAYKDDNLRDDNGIMSALQSLDIASGGNQMARNSNGFDSSNVFNNFSGLNNLNNDINLISGFINNLVDAVKGLFTS